MIQWGWLLANGLWILGCSLALAALSYASWQASYSKLSLRQVVSHVAVTRWFFLAGGLFCAGLAILADSVLERVVWAILTGLSVGGIFALVWEHWRMSRGDRSESN